MQTTANSLQHWTAICNAERNPLHGDLPRAAEFEHDDGLEIAYGSQDCFEEGFPQLQREEAFRFSPDTTYQLPYNHVVAARTRSCTEPGDRELFFSSEVLEEAQEAPLLWDLYVSGLERLCEYGLGDLINDDDSLHLDRCCPRELDGKPCEDEV
nr:hypothetical protein [Crucivirus sp.]